MMMKGIPINAKHMTTDTGVSVGVHAGSVCCLKFVLSGLRFGSPPFPAIFFAGALGGGSTGSDGGGAGLDDGSDQATLTGLAPLELVDAVVERPAGAKGSLRRACGAKLRGHTLDWPAHGAGYTGRNTERSSEFSVLTQGVQEQILVS